MEEGGSDDFCDEWLSDEFGHIAGVFGHGCFALLMAVFQCREGEWLRLAMANGLETLALAHEVLAGPLTSVLIGELMKLDEDQPCLNAVCASILTWIDPAFHNGEAVERTFGADAVDKMHVGGWGEVRKKWGFAGLGLAQDRRRNHWWAWGQKFREIEDREHDWMNPPSFDQKAYENELARHAANSATQRRKELDKRK